MDTRYILINLDDNDDCKLFSNLRVLSSYLIDMYSINKSHMFFQRSLNSNSKLYIDRLLIIKILL